VAFVRFPDGEQADTVDPDPGRDDLLAQGDRLLESSRQLLDDLDTALRRASTAAGPASSPDPQPALDLTTESPQTEADAPTG
jgi:hypothetical protein